MNLCWNCNHECDGHALDHTGPCERDGKTFCSTFCSMRDKANEQSELARGLVETVRDSIAAITKSQIGRSKIDLQTVWLSLAEAAIRSDCGDPVEEADRITNSFVARAANLAQQTEKLNGGE